MVHQLKTTDIFFDAIIDLKKKFEIRVDDRGYRVGDFLALNRVDAGGRETGGCVIVKVTYCLRDPAFVLPGMVIMSIDMVKHLA